MPQTAPKTCFSLSSGLKLIRPYHSFLRLSIDNSHLHTTLSSLRIFHFSSITESYVELLNHVNTLSRIQNTAATVAEGQSRRPTRSQKGKSKTIRRGVN